MYFPTNVHPREVKEQGKRACYALVKSGGSDSEASDDHDGGQDAAKLLARTLHGKELDAP